MEAQYLDLVRHVLARGEERAGRNGMTLSTFGTRLEANLKLGFPLLTTKRVFWKGVVEELLWFLRGSTDATELAAKGVNIWNANSSREFLDSVGLHDVPTGHIGAGYGHQWRRFGAAPGDGAPGKAHEGDQLRYVLTELTTNPGGRRAVLSAWNPLQLDMMALPPCHVMYQFHRDRNGLSCQLVTRSQDLMLGTPFNVASAALFTHILAHVLRLPVGRLIVVGGDVHIYADHVEGAKQQVERKPYDLPIIAIRPEAPDVAAVGIDGLIAFIERLRFEDFDLQFYACHPAIPMAMVP